MTTELKTMLLLAAVLGLALGVMLAWLEIVRAEHTFIAYVYGPDDIPPADISALHEEIRRIQAEADGGGG